MRSESACKSGQQGAERTRTAVSVRSTVPRRNGPFVTRTVVWFSAGAASAVAAKLTLDGEVTANEVVIAYIDPGSEHPDNVRFLAECEVWFGQPIVRLASSRYADTWEVWEKRRFLNSPRGALCTVELKKRVRQDFEQPGDVQVFGYTVEEKRRAERFRQQNPEVDLRCPLIDQWLTKADCLSLVQRAGIELPAMYRLGYANNNCVGCVKGGAGYWNRIRRDFPDVFERMALLERKIGATVLGDVYLDELEPTAGRHREVAPECSLFCGEAAEGFAEEAA